MKRFIQHHAEKIIGVLNGWDRMLFRGTLLGLSYVAGMVKFLNVVRVLRKDFKDYALERTEQLKQASLSQAQTLGRPVIYLPSSPRELERVTRILIESEEVRRAAGEAACTRSRDFNKERFAAAVGAVLNT